MKIAFVKTADPSMASMRFRILIPVEALKKRGHEVEIIKYSGSYPDFMIFSKHFNKNQDLVMMEGAKRDKVKTVYDVCDNHYNTVGHSEYYHKMTQDADIITCNTPVMQEVIKKETGRNAIVVNDSYDTNLPEGKPRFIPNEEPIKILWYGHFTNLNTVGGLVHQLNQLEEGVSLTIISNRPGLTGGKMENVKITHQIWSPETMKIYLEWCNFIAIPTILNNPTKLTKSHNRVTDGIRAGRMVIAHPLPSYEIYRDKYAWIGEDLSDGIIWADENPTEALSKIKAGQKYIEENLSPDKIAKQWEDALG